MSGELGSDGRVLDRPVAAEEAGSLRKTLEKLLAGGLSIRAEIAVVAVFTLLITAPFIFRPFHMDDAGFLELANIRQAEPTEVILHNYTFFGKENDVFLDTHPPLISSYLAVLIRILGGASEAGLHLGFLIFPLTAAVSLYFLARRYTKYALLSSLLLVATPGVMVMSHGLMSDVPGMSLWLAAVTLYVYGLERKSLGIMALCAVVVTAGVFTSYQMLSIIPLLLVYAAVRRELSLLAVLPFVLPLSSFFSYIGWHVTQTGYLPRFSYGVGEPMAWYSIIQKGASATLTLAGAVIFFPILMRVLLVRKWDFAVYLVFLGPLFVAIFLQYASGSFGLAAAMLTIIFLPLGILFVYRIGADGWDRLKGLWKGDRKALADNLLLYLWLAGVLFYVVVLLPYSSVRYLLPLYPPLILLFVRLVQKQFSEQDMARNILLAAVISTASIGILVASADYELASANRDFALNEGAEIGRQAAVEGHQVWFVGEFGFRYYMEQQGFRELPAGREVPEGDIIIQSPLADPRPFSKELADKVELTEIYGYRAALPVRVTNFRAKAGFYGHFWGLLPWSLALGNAEEYLVYEVMPPKEDSEKESQGKKRENG